MSEAAQALGVAESEARVGYQRLTEGHGIEAQAVLREVGLVGDFWQLS